MKQLTVAVEVIRKWPILVWLPLATVAGSSALAVLMMRTVADHLTPDPVVGPILFWPVIWFLAGPAVASGYNAVVGAAAAGDGAPGLGQFWRNLGTYYWRFVGGGLLMGLALSPLGVALGLSSTYSTPLHNPLYLVSFSLLQAFAEVWLAVVVLSGARTIAGIRGAFDTLRRRFADYAVPLGIAVTLAIVSQGVTFSATPPLDLEGARVLLADVPSLLPALLISLVVGVVSAVVRVAVFWIYRADREGLTAGD